MSDFLFRGGGCFFPWVMPTVVYLRRVLGGGWNGQSAVASRLALSQVKKQNADIACIFYEINTPIIVMMETTTTRIRGVAVVF